MERADVVPCGRAGGERRIAELRALALIGLERMYDARASRFVFRLKKTPAGIVAKG